MTSIYPERQKEIKKREAARRGSKKASQERRKTNNENRARGERFEDFLKDFLDLEKQRGSGSGCIEREDLKGGGYLYQLKATNGKSFSVKLCDLEKLMAHAKDCDLTPAFAFGFERGGKFVPSRIFVAVPLMEWMDL